MSTPAPGGQPELTGQVMFYKRPEPLSLERHRNLGVKQIAAPFSFLRTAHAVPITVSEFGVAATCFPIIFVGAEKTPVAVMGVRQNENEYLDANGQPDPDAYLPAFVRRYPFVFAADPGSDRLLLCVDTAAEMVSATPDVKFFDAKGVEMAPGASGVAQGDKVPVPQGATYCEISGASSASTCTREVGSSIPRSQCCVGVL